MFENKFDDNKTFNIAPHQRLEQWPISDVTVRLRRQAYTGSWRHRLRLLPVELSDNVPVVRCACPVSIWITPAPRSVLSKCAVTNHNTILRLLLIIAVISENLQKGNTILFQNTFTAAYPAAISYLYNFLTSIFSAYGFLFAGQKKWKCTRTYLFIYLFVY